MLGLRLEMAGEIERLVQLKIPESSALDYKRELHVDTAGKRKELLKDLSGMGNGGGGAVIFGIAEEEGSDRLPAKTVGLTDRSLVGVIEDVTRAGIQPPLLLTLTAVDLESGFVLVAKVDRSPLGPYRVDAYGEDRYYTRIGTRTVRMSEQQVRDAYLLAARGREGRDELWDAHALPIKPPASGLWLTVSALPEAPLVEIFDPGRDSLEVFDPLPELRLQRQLAGLDEITGSAVLQIWADGVFGEDGHGGRTPTSMLRFHRDGAIGLGHVVSGDNQVFAYSIARCLHAQLVYVEWLWRHFTPRSPVEIVVHLHLVEGAYMQPDQLTVEQIHAPPGIEQKRIAFSSELRPGELARARVRHSIVRGFSDRLHNAFGLPGAEVMFTQGWLHGPDGRSLRSAVVDRAVWNEGGQAIGYLQSDGWIRHVREARDVAFVSEGVVLDPDGRAVAAVEMSTGTGLPDDFVTPELMPSARPFAEYRGEPVPRADGPSPPKPLGEWSKKSLFELLQ